MVEELISGGRMVNGTDSGMTGRERLHDFTNNLYMHPFVMVS